MSSSADCTGIAPVYFSLLPEGAKDICSKGVGSVFLVFFTFVPVILFYPSRRFYDKV